MHPLFDLDVRTLQRQDMWLDLLLLDGTPSAKPLEVVKLCSSPPRTRGSMGAMGSTGLVLTPKDKDRVSRYPLKYQVFSY